MDADKNFLGNLKKKWSRKSIYIYPCYCQKLCLVILTPCVYFHTILLNY